MNSYVETTEERFILVALTNQVALLIVLVWRYATGLAYTTASSYQVIWLDRRHEMSADIPFQWVPFTSGARPQVGKERWMPLLLLASLS